MSFRLHTNYLLSDLTFSLYEQFLPPSLFYLQMDLQIIIFQNSLTIYSARGFCFVLFDFLNSELSKVKKKNTVIQNGFYLPRWHHHKLSWSFMTFQHIRTCVTFAFRRQSGIWCNNDCELTIQSSALVSESKVVKIHLFSWGKVF